MRRKSSSDRIGHLHHGRREMKLIKKTKKPSFSSKVLYSYLYSHAGQQWLIEEDPMTELFNIYKALPEGKEYLTSDESFAGAKSFIKLNAAFLATHSTAEALHI